MFGSTQAAAPIPTLLANIDADQVASNQRAVPAPFMFGWGRYKLNYIAPVYNQINQPVTTQTGKDQSTTVGYIYFADVAGIFGVVGRRIPLQKIRRFIIDSSIAWENTAGMVIANPYSPITLADYGAVRIYAGRGDQPVDTLVLTPISGTIPDGVDTRDTNTFPNGDETQNLP